MLTGQIEGTSDSAHGLILCTLRFHYALFREVKGNMEDWTKTPTALLLGLAALMLLKV